MAKKRFVLITMLLALLVGAAIAVPALAQTPTQTLTPTPPPPPQTLMARVAAILGITEQKLNDAFAQARRETSDEAIDRMLQKAVEKGRITQAQADQYKAWWKARPQTDLPRPFMGKGFGKHVHPDMKKGLRHFRSHQQRHTPTPTPSATGTSF